MASVLGRYFEALFPDYYAQYEQAFKAGRWIAEDPGPFIGRAIVYKLQVECHRDVQDSGPSVCFPTGTFTGGNLIVPQLNSKFRQVLMLYLIFVVSFQRQIQCGVHGLFLFLCFLAQS